MTNKETMGDLLKNSCHVSTKETMGDLLKNSCHVSTKATMGDLLKNSCHVSSKPSFIYQGKLFIIWGSIRSTDAKAINPGGAIRDRVPKETVSLL